MEIKALKLELLERIANLDDEARLLALKRLLDGSPTYGVPSEQLTVVREGESPCLKLEDRLYTAEEVRALVEEVLQKLEREAGDSETLLSHEEWNELDADHTAYLRGEGRNHSWEEVKKQLRKDRGE